MGTGNYRTSEGKTVILHPFDHISCETPDADFEFQIARENFRTDLEEALRSTTFQMVERKWRNSYGRRTDEYVLAENGLYQIWSVEDSYGHMFITYGIHEDLDPDMDGLARAHLDDRAERFFDALQDLFPDMSVATSPWTSAPRTARDQRNAPAEQAA